MGGVFFFPLLFILFICAPGILRYDGVVLSLCLLLCLQSSRCATAAGSAAS